MSKKRKCYVVLSGFQAGITDKGEQCRRMVEHYPGNEYQGFYTVNEAVHWIEDCMQDGKGPYLCQLQGESMTFKEKDGLLNHLYYGIDA